MNKNEASGLLFQGGPKDPPYEAAAFFFGLCPPNGVFEIIQLSKGKRREGSLAMGRNSSSP